MFYFHIFIIEVSVVLFEISLNFTSTFLHCLRKVRGKNGPLMSLPARLRRCNETASHCLSTECLAWRKTILILTEARLLPPVWSCRCFLRPGRVAGTPSQSQAAFRPINYLAPVAFRELREIMMMNASERQEISIYKSVFFKLFFVFSRSGVDGKGWLKWGDDILMFLRNSLSISTPT